MPCTRAIYYKHDVTSWRFISYDTLDVAYEGKYRSGKTLELQRFRLVILKEYSEYGINSSALNDDTYYF